MDTGIIDKATATHALHIARDRLNERQTLANGNMQRLREIIVRFRTSGLVTVDEMAAAIDRDRNYIDSVWSSYGETSKGRQTRIPVLDADPRAAEVAIEALSLVSRVQRKSADDVITARAERDRVVAMVYASKLLGPTAIGTEAGIDRNHVLRIARRNGVAPAHRFTTRNQYSV